MTYFNIISSILLVPHATMEVCTKRGGFMSVKNAVDVKVLQTIDGL